MLNLALHALLPAVKNDLFILGICVALSAWTVLSATKLHGATQRITAAFNEGVQDVCREPDPARFMGAYEACSAALAKNTLLRPAWTGFSHTLIIPITPFRPILATMDARDCFDLGRLYRRAGADLRYHAALPGLLVGAGLLVTFLGLAAGLTAASDVVAEGATQAARNTALRDLLGAASVKFITSLVGLLLSIGYALFRKWQLRTAEHAQAAFLDALDERLPLRTPAALQADANLMAERQYAEVQRIGTDFFVNLGSILETKFSQGLEQHIGPLAAAIEKLSGKLANQNEDAMQGMLSAFLERLEGAIGSSMRDTAATLQTLGERLGGLQSGMDAAAQRMGRAEHSRRRRGYGAPDGRQQRCTDRCGCRLPASHGGRGGRQCKPPRRAYYCFVGADAAPGRGSASRRCYGVRRVGGDDRQSRCRAARYRGADRGIARHRRRGCQPPAGRRHGIDARRFARSSGAVCRHA